jgi:hypothetical protein
MTGNRLAVQGYIVNSILLFMKLLLTYKLEVLSLKTTHCAVMHGASLLSVVLTETTGKAVAEFVLWQSCITGRCDMATGKTFLLAFCWNEID